MRTFLFVLSLLALVVLVNVGLRRSRRDLGFVIAVMSVTLVLILVLYFFTTLYSETHPLFFIFTLFMLIIIMLTIAVRIFKHEQD